MDKLPDELLLKLFEKLSLGNCLNLGATSKRHLRVLSSVCRGREEFREVIVMKEGEEATRVFPDANFVVRHLSKSGFKLRVIADVCAEDLIQVLQRLVDASPNSTSVCLESTHRRYSFESKYQGS